MNKRFSIMPTNYREVNKKVMLDTKHCYENDPKLKKAVEFSIKNQYMVSQEDTVAVPKQTNSETTFIVSGKRSFQAAKEYEGYKLAVLSFANNHSIGGAPFSAGAQEESLCRCSTLFPCLQAMEEPFYVKHQQAFQRGALDYMGNDDLIYTPDVVVFKKDERTDPIVPEMLPEEEWYKVNVITCAAPELAYHKVPDNYEEIITRRIKRILDVAAKEMNEVLILGAWGCGAFGNSTELVASIFFSLLKNYSFEMVEFALDLNDVSLLQSPFMMEYYRSQRLNTDPLTPEGVGGFWGLNDKQIQKLKQYADDLAIETPDERRFRAILNKTGRKGAGDLLDTLKKQSFFTAPASVHYHGNYKGGLVKHSLMVYDRAMELRDQMLKEDPSIDPEELTDDSVAVAALLHDVCKFDEYSIDLKGNPKHATPHFPIGGHGDKSLIMLLGWGFELFPLEELAIKWHMGCSRIEDKKERTICKVAMEEYALCRLIARADYDVAHLNK